MDILYQGLRIEPTLSASRELAEEGKDLHDVLKILEEGYDCSTSKRSQNIVERCIRKGTNNTRWCWRKQKSVIQIATSRRCGE